MEKEVLIWWGVLSSITLVNIFAWLYSAMVVRSQKPFLSIEDYILSHRILILAGIYVVGCGIRAVLPRIDAQRISLFDHWLSSIAIGRSVATIAELCFVAQWALLLHAISKYKDESFVRHISYWIVPIIVVAEVFSWSSVVTTVNFGHVIEESLWAFTACLIFVCFVILHAGSDGLSKKLYALLMSVTVVYLLFMLTVDIPMYLERWQEDIALNRIPLSVVEGFRDLFYRWIVAEDWKTWRAEVPWMTLYFSIAVWTSIALVHLTIMHEFRRARIDQNIKSNNYSPLE